MHLHMQLHFGFTFCFVWFWFQYEAIHPQTQQIAPSACTHIYTHTHTNRQREREREQCKTNHNKTSTCVVFCLFCCSCCCYTLHSCCHKNQLDCTLPYMYRSFIWIARLYFFLKRNWLTDRLTGWLRENKNSNTSLLCICLVWFGLVFFFVWLMLLGLCINDMHACKLDVFGIWYWEEKMRFDHESPSDEVQKAPS